MLAFIRWRSASASWPIQRYCSTPRTISAPPSAINENSATSALRLDPIEPSLAFENSRNSKQMNVLRFLQTRCEALITQRRGRPTLLIERSHGPNETDHHHHRPPHPR